MVYCFVILRAKIGSFSVLSLISSPFFRPASAYRLVFILLLSGFLFSVACAQESLNTLPRYNKESKGLIRQIKENTKVELNKLTIATSPIYSSHLMETRNYQIERIKEEAYFKSDSLTQLVVDVAYQIIDANQLKIKNPIFLINHEPYAQAITYMNGVFEVSIGLLSVIENKDQLAFVLAHELVHNVEYHVANAVFEVYESDIEKTITSEFSRIINGNGTLEGLQEIQAKSYNIFKFSRANEIISDTLGLAYMSKAGFDVKEAQPILSAMGYRYMESDHSVEYLLDQLFRKQYPLKAFWLDKGLNIYTRKPDVLFVFDSDSISTHSELDIRIQTLIELTGDAHTKSLNLDSIEEIARLKCVIDGAYSARQYDVCLYLTLFLLFRDTLQVKNDSFLVSAICKVFLGLYKAKYDNLISNHFAMYVDRYTIDYTDDLRQINWFLHNLTLEELAEVGYQFLNKPQNFDMEIEENYFLLYQFSELTERTGVAENIKDSYLGKFPDGSYLKEFK